MKKYLEGECCPECQVGNLKRQENSVIVFRFACIGRSETMEKGPLSFYTHLKCTSCNKDFRGEVYIPSKEGKTEILKRLENMLRLKVNKYPDSDNS